MTRIALIAASCVLLLSGCASTAKDGGGRQDIFLPQGEFDTITISAPAVKQVHCPACDKDFAVHLVRGEATSPQDIVVPSGESGGYPDSFDASVKCSMCGKMVDVRVHRHTAPAK